MRLDKCAGDGFFGGFVTPDNELKHGIKALAFVDGDVNDGLCLIDTQQSIRRHQAAVAEQ